MDFFKANKSLYAACVFAIIVLVFGAYHFLFSAPSSFPSGSIIVIAQGSSLPQVAEQLADAHVISRPLILELILRAIEGSTRIQAGAYLFQKPQNLFTIAYRLVAGEYGLPAVRMTFVEGVTVREMSEQIIKSFPNISAEAFNTLAKFQEGYLFPDTYFFSPGENVASIVRTVRANFDAKIKPLQGAIRDSGHSLSDIVIMASLVEREARDIEDRRMIAGILWNRLSLNMPLQVDAVFGYIKNKETYSPSLADLKIDSPYNTYTHKGLPPGPICNPGIEAIEAVLNPAKTDYLYYLTGKDGVMRYAKTYALHQTNQTKYLR